MKQSKIRYILSSPFLLLLLFIFNPVNVWGQATPESPDCGPTFINLTLTAGSGATIAVPSAAGFNNRTTGCQFWLLAYQTTVTSGALTSVAFQSANGAVAAGTFNNWPGSILGGINPNTNQSDAISSFSTGCASMVECATDNSWVRILITRNTFVGTINGVLYGYKNNPGSGSGGGGGGGCTTPCPVEGVAADGTPPTVPPVPIAGTDGTDVRGVSTDIGGRLIPANASSADADTVSNTENTQTGTAGGILYPRVFNRVFNGTTWDRMRGTILGLFSQGPVAGGVASAGNPLKIGGPFNTTQPTYTNGQMAEGQFIARGAFIAATGVDTFHVTCDSGCTPGSLFSDNSAFTAGSTGVNINGGWYSTTPTNCTDGNACAPQLTIDRKLFVQAFQGTSPWVVSQSTASNLNAQVVGAVASGGANSGNPLKIGGPFNTTQPTVTNGQIVDGQFSARGSLLVTPGIEGFPVSTIPPGTATAQADGATNSPVVPTLTGAAPEGVPTYPHVFNGVTWDRQRGDTSGTTPSNASSAASDANSNTQLAPTDVNGTALFHRVFSFAFNGATWDRVVGNTSGLAPTNASSALADTLSNTELSPTAVGGGVLYSRAFGHVFNGTTWDRMRGNSSGLSPSSASSAGADAINNTNTSPTDSASTVIYYRNLPMLFNGTTWDRAKGNTSGASPSNASSAGADTLSNTELTPTDSAGTVLYPRVFASVFNGTTWDRLRGNTTGVAPANASVAGADGINNTIPTPTDVAGNQMYARELPYVFNGATNDRQYGCTNQAPITLSTGTDVVIAAGVSSTNIRICHLDFSSDTSASVTIRQGTGTTCLTNTAALTGVYPGVVAAAFDYSNIASLRTTVAARDVCLHFSTSVTVGGVVIYAQF